MTVLQENVKCLQRWAQLPRVCEELLVGQDLLHFVKGFFGTLRHTWMIVKVTILYPSKKCILVKKTRNQFYKITYVKDYTPGWHYVLWSRDFLYGSKRFKVGHWVWMSQLWLMRHFHVASFSDSDDFYCCPCFLLIESDTLENPNDS